MEYLPKRILVVCHSYYPKIDPRAFRWRSICEYWAQKDMIVDVICAHSQKGLPHIEEVNGVNIHRIKDASHRIRSAKVQQDLTTSKKARFSSPKTVIMDFFKLFVATIRWPDRDWLWILPAYRYAKKLMETDRYHYLITVSHPYSGHLVGKKIKKHFPNPKWLVDIGDPFSFAIEMPLNNFRLYRRLNYLSEKSIFEQADSVAVTNARTAERYIELFGERNSAKIHVIGPLIEFDSFVMHKISATKKTNEIKLMFAGNLLNPVRRPDLFLPWAVSVINSWEMKNPSIKFDIYGDPLIKLQKYIPVQKVIGKLRIHGQISKSEVVSALDEADILVNCGNITDYQLPSKIYEYMATGKPIINFIVNPKDASLQAMKDYPKLLNVLAGETDIHSVLKFIELCIEPTIIEHPKNLMHVLRDHSVSSIADCYLELLN